MNGSQLARILNTADESVSTGTPGTYIPEQHPCRLFHTYWRSLAQGRAAPPQRADFSPGDIPRLLPFLLILDVLPREDGRAYRYRLVGTEIVDMLATDPTGKRLDEVISPDILQDRQRLYDQSVDRQEAIFTARHVPVERRSFIPVYTALFPFATERDGPVRQLFLVAARREVAL